MRKASLAVFLYFFLATYANAQLGVMKLVGSDSENYKLGFGAFVKVGVPATKNAEITIELGVNSFQAKEGDGQGTIMCPAKAGFRYFLSKPGEGFYLEPQLGYNVYGVTSVLDENSQNVDLKYNGIVLAAGGGYVFLIGRTPININLRYETVMAHGGSNNLVSLGITRAFTFGNKSKEN